MPPTEWGITKLEVLFKKGVAQMPQNYRPISIIPVMSKLLSTVMYLRIVSRIGEQPSEEQFGFRKGRGVRGCRSRDENDR